MRSFTVKMFDVIIDVIILVVTKSVLLCRREIIHDFYVRGTVSVTPLFLFTSGEAIN